MDQFPPDIDHDLFSSTETTLFHGSRVRSKPVRSRGPWLRVIPSDSSSLARAAEKTGPSGGCPGTMATVHSNVYKHRATKRVRLTFDSYFEILPVSFSRQKKNWSIRREMLPRLSPSVTIHIGANKRATTKYASS